MTAKYALGLAALLAGNYCDASGIKVGDYLNFNIKMESNNSDINLDIFDVQAQKKNNRRSTSLNHIELQKKGCELHNRKQQAEYGKNITVYGRNNCSVEYTGLKSEEIVNMVKYTPGDEELSPNSQVMWDAGNRYDYDGPLRRGDKLTIMPFDTLVKPPVKSIFNKATTKMGKFKNIFKKKKQSKSTNMGDDFYEAIIVADYHPELACGETVALLKEPLKYSPEEFEGKGRLQKEEKKRLKGLQKAHKDAVRKYKASESKLWDDRVGQDVVVMTRNLKTVLTKGTVVKIVAPETSSESDEEVLIYETHYTWDEEDNRVTRHVRKIARSEVVTVETQCGEQYYIRKTDINMVGDVFLVKNEEKKVIDAILLMEVCTVLKWCDKNKGFRQFYVRPQDIEFKQNIQVVKDNKGKLQFALTKYLKHFSIVSDSQNKVREVLNADLVFPSHKHLFKWDNKFVTGISVCYSTTKKHVVINLTYEKFEYVYGRVNEQQDRLTIRDCPDMKYFLKKGEFPFAEKNSKIGDIKITSKSRGTRQFHKNNIIPWKKLTKEI